MKTSNTAQLQKLVDQFDANTRKVKALSKRVRTLTRQRDQANARNAELRATLAAYQRNLAETRSQLRSGWDSAERSPA